MPALVVQGTADLRPSEPAEDLAHSLQRCELLLVPGHCDPTVNLYDEYVAVRGGRVEALWPITARGAERLKEELQRLHQIATLGSLTLGSALAVCPVGPVWRRVLIFGAGLAALRAAPQPRFKGRRTTVAPAARAAPSVPSLEASDATMHSR